MLWSAARRPDPTPGPCFIADEPPPEGAVEVLVDHLRANLEQEGRSAL